MGTLAKSCLTSMRIRSPALSSPHPGVVRQVAPEQDREKAPGIIPEKISIWYMSNFNYLTVSG